MTIDTRRMLVCMDRTVSADSGNEKLLNTIISKLKSLGFNAQRLGWGPNSWSNWVHNQGGYKERNCICVFVCNGIDAGVVEECTENYGYNKTSEYPKGKDNRWHGSNGFLYKDHNNSMCWAGFYGCADFYNEGGKYYKWLVRAHDDNYSPSSFKGIPYPRKLMEEYGIKVAFKPDDYSGEGIAVEIAKQYGYGDNSPETPNTPVTTETSTETSTEANVEQQQVFTIDNLVWNKVIVCKTNENGAFCGHLKLPFAGEFRVNVYYAGNSLIAPTDHTITIQNRVGVPYVEPEKQTIILSTGSGTSPTTTGGGATTSTLTGRVSPFANKVAMLRDSGGNPIPDSDHMAVGSIPCENYSASKTYTMSYSQYQEVQERNSKCMQLHGYKLAQFNMFQTTDNKIIVLPRGKWNCIEEAMNFYLVSIKGGNVSGDITVDFPKKQITVGGKTINFKNDNVSNVLVSDKQNTDYTCGPTASSMCTQVLRRYMSEQNLQGSIGASPGSGCGPDAMVRVLKNRGFTAELVSSRDSYKSWMKDGKPCVIHRYNHYICGGAYHSDSNSVLIGNGAFQSSNYGPAPGWHSFTFSLYGSGVKVGLNWSITESSAIELKNWYASMGGDWAKPNPKEEIRKTGW